MPPMSSQESGGLNNLLMAVIGGLMALVTTLILASYAYTWAESNKQTDEKVQWRKEHQQVLDKKFEEVKQNQQRLADRIEESNDKTRDLLQQVLEEQRKYSERIGEKRNNTLQRSH